MSVQLNFLTFLKMLLVVFLLALLAACDRVETPTPGNVLQSTSATPEPSATFTSSPSPTTTSTASPRPCSTLTPTPTRTPKPTIGPSWKSWYPLLEPVEVFTSDIIDEEVQDLIIFTAEWASFANTRMRLEDKDTLILIAFSPDGQRAGTLSQIEYNSFIYIPSDPLEKTLLVDYGINFDHPAVQGIELPPECYPERSATGRFSPCNRFQFSSDGRYLGFFYNAPYPGGGCGQGIIIMETQTGEFVYHLPELSGFNIKFLDNRKVLIYTGHCEGGDIALVDLNDRTERELGVGGRLSWNLDRTAFAVETHPYQGIYSSIWGFNFELERYFMRVPETRQIDDHPIWTPDRRYLLYQHRTFSRRSDEVYGGIYPTEFDQSRQIILVDAQTGGQQILLSDPDYDFHLGSCWSCDDWYGNWIQVRRVAFAPEAITEDYDNCRIYGGNCSTPVELFALNWKTRELAPWDEVVEAGLVPDLDSIEEPGPDLTQAPVYEFPRGRLYPGPDENTMWYDGYGNIPWLTGPDLETSPIYTHPDGLYAYYVGIDGKTLWMVPAEGEPILWVLEGENYFYLPPRPETD